MNKKIISAMLVLFLLAANATANFSFHGGGSGVSDPCKAAWNAKQGKSKITIVASDASAAEILSADYACDGTADDVQIQAAMYEAKDFNGTVQLVGKSFYIDTSMTIPDNITLDLGGATVYGTANLHYEVFTRNNTTITPVAYRTSASAMAKNIVIRNGRIDGSAMYKANVGTTSATGGKGIFINFLKDCRFENVTIKNTPSTGFGNDYGQNITFIDCNAISCGTCQKIDAGGEYEGCSGFGLGMSGIPDDGEIVLINCRARNNTNSGITFEGVGSGLYYDSRNNKCIGCICSGNKYGFQVDDSTTTATNNNVTFSNCSAYENNVGLYIPNSGSNIKVIGCEFYNNIKSGGTLGQGIIISIASLSLDGGNVVVDGCQIYGNASEGIWGMKRNIIITNSQIFNNEGYGIWIDGFSESVTGLTITNNQIYHNELYGIHIYPRTNFTISDIFIIGNYIGDNTMSWVIDDINGDGTNITCKTANANKFLVGDSVTVVGTAGFDATYTIASVASTTTFRITSATSGTEMDVNNSYVTANFIRKNILSISGDGATVTVNMNETLDVKTGDTVVIEGTTTYDGSKTVTDVNSWYQFRFAGTGTGTVSTGTVKLDAVQNEGIRIDARLGFVNNLIMTHNIVRGNIDYQLRFLEDSPKWYQNISIIDNIGVTDKTETP